MRATRMTATGFALALALSGLATTSTAEEVSEETLAQARALGTKGLELYDQGNCAEAIDYLERARALYDAPTLGLHAGICMQKLGRLVEASERYLAVLRMEVGSGDSAAFKEAVASAAARRDELLPKIPKLTIVTKDRQGAAIPTAELEARGIRITIDDKEQPLALINVERPADPGNHVFVAIRSGQEIARADKELAEGATDSVELALPPLAELDASPSPAPGATPSSDGDGSGQVIAGVVSLGIGVVGVGLGAVAGLIAVGKKSSLDDSGSCVDRQCTDSPDGQIASDIDSYDTMRTLSTVGFVVGGVGIVGGVVLLLTAPSSSDEDAEARLQPGVTPWVGVGSAGVRGRF